MLLETNEQLSNLVYESYFIENDKRIEVVILLNELDEEDRHQSYYDFIFQRQDNLKYYQGSYSKSIKDTMGWDECNYPPHEFVEVEPIETTVTSYRIKEKKIQSVLIFYTQESLTYLASYEDMSKYEGVLVNQTDTDLSLIHI